MSEYINPFENMPQLYIDFYEILEAEKPDFKAFKQRPSQ